MRLARQVDDQRLAARSGHLPREDCGRRLAEARAPELLAEAWQFPGDDLAHGLRRLVARGRPRPAGREDEIGVLIIA